MVGPAGTPHVETWVRAFRAAGHIVEIVSLGDTRKHRLWAVARSAWEITRGRVHPPPDLTVVHSLGTHGLFALARGLRGRVVVVPWGSEVVRAAPGSFRWRVARRLLTAADLVVVTSKAMAESLEDRWPGASKRVRVISWGADTVLFRPAPDSATVAGIRRRFGVAEDDLCVVSARGFRAVYRPFLIEDAFLQALVANPRLRLLVAGYDDDLERADDRAGARGAVHHLGWLAKPDLADLYSVADAVISVPTHDQRSTSVLEAASSGALLVLSDIPANRELLADGLDCVLVDAADHSELVSVLQALAPRTDVERASAHLWVETHEAQSTQMQVIVEECIDDH